MYPPSKIKHINFLIIILYKICLIEQAFIFKINLILIYVYIVALIFLF